MYYVVEQVLIYSMIGRYLYHNMRYILQGYDFHMCTSSSTNPIVAIHTYFTCVLHIFLTNIFSTYYYTFQVCTDKGS